MCISTSIPFRHKTNNNNLEHQIVIVTGLLAMICMKAYDGHAFVQVFKPCLHDYGQA